MVDSEVVPEVSSEVLGSKASGSGEEDEVEIQCLKPMKLITIEVEMGGSKVWALIDSGASRTLIRKTVGPKEDEGEEVESDQCIMGLGESRINVIRECQMTIKYCGFEEKKDVLVVEDGAIKYDAILGMDFLKSCQMKIDMAKRKNILHQ